MGVKTEPKKLSETNVTETNLIAQLRRMKGYHGFESWRDELLKILWAEANSDGHAERIIDHVLASVRPNDEGFSACPVPAVFREFCRQAEVNPRTAGWQGPSRTCKKCRGTGFVSVTRKIKSWHANAPPMEVDSSEPCECRKATVSA